MKFNLRTKRGAVLDSCFLQTNPFGHVKPLFGQCWWLYLPFQMRSPKQPDLALFDFTRMYQSRYAARILEKSGKRLLVALVGDSLVEVRIHLERQIFGAIQLKLTCTKGGACL